MSMSSKARIASVSTDSVEAGGPADAAGATANIFTVVRVRPLSTTETERNTRIIVSHEEGSRRIGVMDPAYFALLSSSSGDSATRRKNEKSFVFDEVLWSVEAANDQPCCSQQDVYDKCAKQSVQHCLDGYNCSIFAYGQTGSGKTYTMTGVSSNESHSSLSVDVAAGVIPRLCRDVITSVSSMKEARTMPFIPGSSFANYTLTNARVFITYFEIYNEKVHDLLSESATIAYLRVREHPSEGAYVEGLIKTEVKSFEDIDALLRYGEKRRSVGSTLQNIASSRSHAIFTIHVHQDFEVVEDNDTKRTVATMQRRGKVNLIDLAGSERASLTGASGVRLREANNINKSLSTLGDVIISLSERADKSPRPANQVDNNLLSPLSNISSGSPSISDASSFVPYRNSLLTWLLKDSIGGNSKCTV
jgi:hypothetical protein